MTDLRSKCGLLRLVALEEYPPIEQAEVTRPEPFVSVTLTVRALGPEQARDFERLFIEWLEALDTRPTDLAPDWKAARPLSPEEQAHLMSVRPMPREQPETPVPAVGTKAFQEALEEGDSEPVCGVIFHHPTQSLCTHCRAGAPGHEGPHVNPYETGED